VRFTLDAHPGLDTGTTTVTFRAWKRPQVKVGGRYNVGGSRLEVDAISQVRAGDITDADARLAGETSRAGVRKRLDVDDDTLVYRIDFHRVGGAQRGHPDAANGAPDAVELETIAQRLARLDRTRGPWTAEVLALIAAHPEVVSTALAAAVGQDRPDFKVNVRKLKALGLTESLLVGYRLTPRGQAVLRHLEASK
jgi:hypothetical protein